MTYRRDPKGSLLLQNRWENMWPLSSHSQKPLWEKVTEQQPPTKTSMAQLNNWCINLNYGLRQASIQWTHQDEVCPVWRPVQKTDAGTDSVFPPTCVYVYFQFAHKTPEIRTKNLKYPKGWGEKLKTKCNKKWNGHRRNHAVHETCDLNVHCSFRSTVEGKKWWQMKTSVWSNEEAVTFLIITLKRASLPYFHYFFYLKFH